MGWFGGGRGHTGHHTRKLVSSGRGTKTNLVGVRMFSFWAQTKGAPPLSANAWGVNLQQTIADPVLYQSYRLHCGGLATGRSARRSVIIFFILAVIKRGLFCTVCAERVTTRLAP